MATGKPFPTMLPGPLAPRCRSVLSNSVQRRTKPLLQQQNNADSNGSERLLVRVEEAFKETLQQACEGVGRSRHADWGPKEQSNFSSLLPMTYPKWQECPLRGRGKKRGRKNDAVTCDSSEVNRAWSSLPAETLPCLPLTDRKGPSHSTHPASKIHIFFLCGKSLFAQAKQRCFRTTDSAPVAAPPPLDSINSPYNREEGSGKKGKNNEAYRKLTISKKGNDRGYILVCKKYSYGD
ncbi:hypothetical protein PAMP_015177 [Pampus punctatissimus]